MKTLEQASILELKAEAFDINQKILQLQNNYKIVLEEISKRNQVKPEQEQLSN